MLKSIIKACLILVENIFNLISEKENLDESEISPNVIELSGSYCSNFILSFDIKSEYGKQLENKYS